MLAKIALRVGLILENQGYRERCGFLENIAASEFHVTCDVDGVYTHEQIKAIQSVYNVMVSACESLAAVNSVAQNKRRTMIDQVFASIHHEKRLSMFYLFNTFMPTKFDTTIEELAEYVRSSVFDGTYEIKKALQIVYSNILEDEMLDSSLMVDSVKTLENLEVIKTLASQFGN